MPHPLHPEFRSDVPFDPRTLNRMQADERDADREIYRFTPPPFLLPGVWVAQITSRDGALYAWTKLCTVSGGTDDEDAGHEGTLSGSGNLLPARELTGSTSITTPQNVLMWYSDDGTETRFIAPA